MENDTAISAFAREILGDAGLDEAAEGYDSGFRYYVEILAILQRYLPNYEPDFDTTFRKALDGDSEAREAVKLRASLFSSTSSIGAQSDWAAATDDEFIEGITPPGFTLNSDNRALVPILRQILLDRDTREAQSKSAPVVDQAEPEPSTRGRGGPRVKAALPDLFRLPMAQPVKNALLIFGRGQFQEVDGDTAIFSAHDGTQVRIDCDPQTGFGPERAIQILATKGPSVIQTFLAMAALWLDKKPGAAYDSKLEISVTDLLRFMGRKPATKGGYRKDDISTRGRDVYILMVTTVPTARAVTYQGKKKTRVEMTISRMAHIEQISVQFTLDEDDPNEIITFRYHLDKEIYDWLAGEHPQYALASSKLLQYHPERQRYQILLGFAMTYFDKVNRKNRGQGPREITLTSLLGLAAIDVPNRNVPRFLQAIANAILELAKDGVIPDAKLLLPANKQTMDARAQIGAAKVEFPRLIEAKADVLQQ